MLGCSNKRKLLFSIWYKKEIKTKKLTIKVIIDFIGFVVINAFLINSISEVMVFNILGL